MTPGAPGVVGQHREGRAMPVVQVHVKAGSSVETKRRLVAGITSLMNEVCGSDPERVHVITDEVHEDSRARAGRLLADLR
jgi:4-oxalocrotonate tautomerase family enzyme